jgi:hypothetical protein
MQTTTTTKIFRIDLILDAIGTKRFIRYRATPTSINITTIFSTGIFYIPRGITKAIADPISGSAENSVIHCLKTAIFGFPAL